MKFQCFTHRDTNVRLDCQMTHTHDGPPPLTSSGQFITYVMLSLTFFDNEKTNQFPTEISRITSYRFKVRDKRKQYSNIQFVIPN